MSARVNLLTGCLATCVLTTTSVDAGNCALRNPDRQVYEIFPDATSYRTMVESVDVTLRPKIEAQLGSRLAFGDLGKHTVCIVYREKMPLGVVHARTELGTYGSIELVWALDLDMRIKDFRVQRSRERHTDALRAADFRNKLIGRDVRRLRALLSDSNETVDAAALEVPRQATQLAHLAVVSGAKTILITDAAFGAGIHRARLMGQIHESFPATSKIKQIKEPFNSESLGIIERLTGSSFILVDRDSFTALRSLDENGAILGALACSRQLQPSTGPEYWWTVSATGRIIRVWRTGVRDDAAKPDLRNLVGKDLDDIAQLPEISSESIGRHALEVLATIAASGIGG